jgi:cellulose synthase/poly-beta-1,6-N-acetylglucosamine synthase-like glycosyltransferase
MIEKSLLAFWGAWVFLLLAAAFRVFGFSIARRHQDRRLRGGSGPQKPVVLIVPVKGFDLQSTPRFFDAIFGQTYRDYRVIVCFESWEDPVALWLCEHLELSSGHPAWSHPDPAGGLRGVTLVCAGLAENEGQKVHNQRAAFAELAPQDAIIAFADADILCGPDWLARLVAPINRGEHELSTTYRWLVPKRPTLPNQLASVINASITTQGGAQWSTVLWGGSMAVTRGVFDELDVPNLLAGSLNDDLRLSKAARATGRKIAFVRSLILPTPIDFTWAGFFEFVRRQYTQVKFFSPILYTGVNLVLAFYMLGLLSVIGAIVYGYFFAWIPLAAAYVIDQFRALARQQLYLSLFPDTPTRRKLFATSWLEHMLTPLWMCLHWVLLASTWTQNRISWGGIRYRILSKSKTRVLDRLPSTSHLPAGAPGLAMIGALHDLRRGSTTQPIRPMRFPAEPVAPLAWAGAEAESRIIGSTRGVSAEVPVALEPAPAVSSADSSAAASPARPVPASVVDAPSAIVALAKAIGQRRDSRGPRPVERDRGSRSAVEKALRKTRLISSPRFAIGRPDDSALALPAAGPVPTSRRVPARLPLSTPVRLLSKARCERFPIVPVIPMTKRPVSRSAGSVPSARLASKVRSSPAIGRARNSGTSPSPMTGTPPAPSASLRTRSHTSSLAARRAGPGAPFRSAVADSRCLAHSSRTVPAARPSGMLPARPMSRGASVRP